METKESKPRRLPPVRHMHLLGMYVVTEADAAAIREVYERDGELSAAIELRRRLPGIADNATAGSRHGRIAAWPPLPERPAQRRRGTTSRGKADADTR